MSPSGIPTPFALNVYWLNTAFIVFPVMPRNTLLSAASDPITLEYLPTSGK